MLVKQKTDVIQRAIELGDAHGGNYLVLPHIGFITKPVNINGWTGVPFDQDTSYKPEEALFHLALMRENFPVNQVLILHEPEPERKEIKVPELPKSNNENLKKILSVAAKVAVAGAVIVGYAAYTALTAVAMVDPALIVCFEGEEDWMLCIATWDEV